jgi:hypothetical protein
LHCIIKREIRYSPFEAAFEEVFASSKAIALVDSQYLQHLPSGRRLSELSADTVTIEEYSDSVPNPSSNLVVIDNSPSQLNSSQESQNQKNQEEENLAQQQHINFLTEEYVKLAEENKRLIEQLNRNEAEMKEAARIDIREPGASVETNNNLNLNTNSNISRGAAGQDQIEVELGDGAPGSSSTGVRGDHVITIDARERALNMRSLTNTRSTDQKQALVLDAKDLMSSAFSSIEWPDAMPTTQRELWLGQAKELLSRMIEQNIKDFSGREGDQKNIVKEYLTLYEQKKLAENKPGIRASVVRFLYDYTVGIIKFKLKGKEAKEEFKEILIRASEQRGYRLTAEDAAFIRNNAFNQLSKAFVKTVVVPLCEITACLSIDQYDEAKSVVMELFKGITNASYTEDPVESLKESNKRLVNIVRALLEIEVGFIQNNKEAHSNKEEQRMNSENSDFLLRSINGLYRYNQGMYAIGYQIEQYNTITFGIDYDGFLQVSRKIEPKEPLGNISNARFQNPYFEILSVAAALMINLAKNALKNGQIVFPSTFLEEGNLTLNQTITAHNNHIATENNQGGYCTIL